MSSRLESLLIRTVEGTLSPFVRFGFGVAQGVKDASYAVRKKFALVRDYSVEPGTRSSTTYAVVSVFANRRLPRSTLNYIAKLSEQDLDIHVVCNGFLDKESLEKLSPFVYKITCRENIGRDFAAYKVGVLTALEDGITERILITNDSCFVALDNLGNVFYEMSKSGTDFWGLTESTSPAYHIQSFFMVFSSKIIRSKVFKKYWMKYPYNSNRHFAIKRGEIGLTKMLIKKGGFSPGVYNNTAQMSRILDSFSLGELIELLGIISNLNSESAVFASEGIISKLSESRYQEISPDILAVEKVKLRRFLMKDISEGSEIHGIGLIFIKYGKGVLLKKDLVLKGIYSLLEIEYHLRQLDVGLDHDEIMGYFRMKGSFKEQSVFNRILISSGHK